MIILLGCSARWIGNHGFSIGIDDVQPKEELIEKKDNTIKVGYEDCNRFIEAFNEGKLVLKAGCDAAQTLEAEITKVLNGLRDAAGKVSISFFLKYSGCVSDKCLHVNDFIIFSDLHEYPTLEK